VGTGENKATASVGYTINRADPKASDFTFIAPTELEYNGNAKTATVTANTGITGMGDVTVKYYDEAGNEAEPKNAGTYTVKINVAEGTNYNAVSELTGDGWKFSITKGTYSGNKSDKTIDIVKGRSTAQSGTLTAADFFPEGTTLPAGAKITNVTGSGSMMQVTLDTTKDPHTLTYTSSTNVEAAQDETYTVTISTTNYNDFTVTLIFRPVDKQPQTGFKFTGVKDGKVTKTYGDADFTFEATGKVEDSKEVLYFSSEPTVATVGSDGKVHILSTGTTTIKATASATDDYAQGVATYELTVNAKTLTKADLTYSGPITKGYDGSTNAPSGLTVSVNPSSLVNDDTLDITGSAVYNSKDVKDANTITFTPNAITTGNYRLSAAEVLTITGASITKATPTYTTPTNLTAKYGQKLADVTLPTGWNWMNSNEPVGDASTAVKIFKAKFTPGNTDNYNMVENIELEVTVKQAAGGNLKTVELTLPYGDSDEHTYTPDWSELPQGQIWNYGIEYSVSTGSTATLTKQDVAAADGTLTYAVSGGKAGDVITITLKAQCNNYEDFTVTVNLTITQATTTGTPGYTKITTSGKTLADAGLTIGTLNPGEGTLVWVDEDGNVLGSDTKVEANKSYTWRFTPSGGNYTTRTGEIELYHRSSGYYYYPTDTGTGTKPSAGTGDAGLLPYAVTALMSYTGTAALLRRRKRED